MNFEISTVLSLVVAIGGGIAAFFSAKAGVKDYMRDKIDELKSQQHKLELEIERLKNKDELQQQIIDQLDKHVLKNLPTFFEVLKKHNNGN